MKVEVAFKEFMREIFEENGWDKEQLELERIELAKEMLFDGEPLEKIVKYTKLPLETINKIRQSILVSNN